MITAIRKNLTKTFYENPFLFSFIVFLLIYAGYDYSVHKSSGTHLVSLQVLALIAGVIFESKRISNKWTTSVLIGIISFIFIFFFGVFLCTIVGESDCNLSFILDRSLTFWPFIFFVFYVMYSRIFNERNITPKLTEGITLFLSIAMIYWVADNGLINFDNIISQTIMVIGILFSLFSFFHAFTRTYLSDRNKLILSIWSSIIMMFFAVDNLNSIYNQNIINSNDILQGIYIAIQYFLLGISSIYMIQNFMMLIGFLPRWKRFFNSRYFKELRELKDEHIDRYSEEQVNYLDSIFCIVLIGSVFYLNYYYEFVSRQFIIWISFVIFPVILNLFNHVTGKKRFAYLLFLVLFISCQNKEDKTIKINPENINLNEVVSDLTPEQIEKIKTIHAIFAEVDKSSLEQTITDFKRDLHPENEIEIWMQMADAYKGYLSKNKKNLDEKKEVFKLILSRSMMSSQETLENTNLEYLSKKEAEEVLSFYNDTPQPLIVKQSAK